MKKKILVISLFVCCFLFAVNAHAVEYTYCRVDQIITSNTGNIRLIVYEGVGQDYWEGEGAARLQFDTSDAGGKAMLATVLTAISLGSEVRFTTDVMPALNPIYYINAVSIVAP